MAKVSAFSAEVSSLNPRIMIALIAAVPIFLLLNYINLTLRPEMVLIVAMLLALGAQWIVNNHRSNIRDRELAENAKDGEDDLMTRLKMRKRMASHAKGGSAGTIESVGGFGGLILLVILMTQFSKINEPGVFKIAAAVLTAAMAGLVFTGARTKGHTPIGCYAALVVMALATAVLVLDPFHSDDLPMYILSVLCLASVIWVCVDLLILHNRECSNAMPQFETHQGGEDNA